MKILIADKLSSIGIDFLKEQDGFDVIEIYDLPKGERQEKLLELVPEVGGIIVRSDSKITREVLEKAPKLKAVGRAGVGWVSVDRPRAQHLGPHLGLHSSGVDPRWDTPRASLGPRGAPSGANTVMPEVFLTQTPVCYPMLTFVTL